MIYKLTITTTQRGLALLLLWASMMCIGGLELYAADSKVGTFSVIRGSVDALHEETTTPIAATKGMDAYMNDVIRTKRRSRARLSFTDGSILNMGANHMVNVKEYSFDQEKNERHVIVSALRGSIRATVAKFAGDSVFQVETPTAVVTVRGTDFIVVVGPDGQTTVTVISGTVIVKAENGATVTLAAGQQTSVAKNESPTAPVKVSAKMMKVLQAKTAVEAVDKTDSTQANTIELESTSSSTNLIKVSQNLFQRVQTNDNVNILSFNPAKENTDPNNPLNSSVTPPITSTITNLQGCPPGQSSQQVAGVPAILFQPAVNGVCSVGFVATVCAAPGACIANANAVCVGFIGGLPGGNCTISGAVCNVGTCAPGTGICAGAIASTPGTCANGGAVCNAGTCVGPATGTCLGFTAAVPAQAAIPGALLCQ